MTSRVVTLNIYPPKPVLRHVPTAEFRQYWPRVRAGLARLCADARLVCDWTPEDVYVQLHNGAAFLALISEGADGFFVWQRYPGDDGRGVLFILACEGNGVLRHSYAELDDMARKVNCKCIRQISMRKGWEGDYWKMTGYVYEHEVTT